VPAVLRGAGRCVILAARRAVRGSRVCIRYAPTRGGARRRALALRLGGRLRAVAIAATVVAKAAAARSAAISTQVAPGRMPRAQSTGVAAVHTLVHRAPRLGSRGGRRAGAVELPRQQSRRRDRGGDRLKRPRGSILTSARLYSAAHPS
jgi:hypothetical protein